MRFNGLPSTRCSSAWRSTGFRYTLRGRGATGSGISGISPLSPQGPSTSDWWSAQGTGRLPRAMAHCPWSAAQHRTCCMGLDKRAVTQGVSVQFGGKLVPAPHSVQPCVLKSCARGHWLRSGGRLTRFREPPCPRAPRQQLCLRGGASAPAPPPSAFVCVGLPAPGLGGRTTGGLPAPRGSGQRSLLDYWREPTSVTGEAAEAGPEAR